jgi:hypothetical protein
MEKPVEIDPDAKIDGKADGTAEHPFPSVWAALGAKAAREKRAAEAESDRQPEVMTG